MDCDQISPILNVFAQDLRCFTLEELADFAGPDSNTETLKHSLLTDSRFVRLNERDSDQAHFVSSRSLFQWFCRLSVRLAQVKQTRLYEGQLALLASSLRMDERWNTPPTEVVEFGSRFGFVARSYTTGQCIFPIAHILSFMKVPTVITDDVMEHFQTEKSAHLIFEELGHRLIQDGLSRVAQMFSDKVRYVVQAREGLLTGERMTLQDVGAELGGFTREWARQLETRFWTTILKRPRGRSLARVFSAALICNIVCNKGGLVIHQGAPEVFLLTFLAKCANVPWGIFPGTEMVILGNSQKDLRPGRFHKSANPSPEEADIDSIGSWLESVMHLCLTPTDLRTLAENIERSRPKVIPKPLTKVERAYLALRAIGRPAHYTEIAEVYNSLFPSEPTTERNLHAVLGRERHGVVWIGIRGTFALREWGYKHPSKGLFDAVTEIVRQKYEDVSQPIPFAVIVAEMGKRRRIVNPNSLTIAAHCNPNLLHVGKDSFVPKECSKETQEQVSGEELDRILKEFERKDESSAL